MTVAELIAKLQELARYTPDAPVVIYDADAFEDRVDITTVGQWSMYDDDNSFVFLNHPEDKSA
jgi:hypothetical protein